MSVTEYKTPSLTLQVHENYIVAKAHTLVKISEKELTTLAIVANKHFTGPFGLIEIRDEHISIEPELHARAKETLPGFAAYALVTKSVRTVKNLHKEYPFMNYEGFNLFATEEDAVEWVNQLLAENNKQYEIA